MGIKVDKDDVIKREKPLLPEEELEKLEKDFDVDFIDDIIIALPKMAEDNHKETEIKQEWLK